MSDIRTQLFSFASGALLGKVHKAVQNYLQKLGLIGASASLAILVAFPAFADVVEINGVGNIATPSTRAELPIEVETEVSPAGSLKNVPLWKEVVELLEDPHNYTCDPDDPATLYDDESIRCISGTERRESFLATEMPPLTIVNPCHNILTGQSLRFQPGGELDWNQPGPLFDPSEIVGIEDPVTNIPSEVRTIIGYLVIDEASNELVVANPGPNVGDPGVPNPMIPPDGTAIAESACVPGDGRPQGQMAEDGVVIEELEQPPNELHFIADRLMAEVLGKALFWDMQVGSDGVQACGSCHFTNGVDARTRNQLNPNHLGGDNTLQVRGPNEDVIASDFPFHKRNPDTVGDGPDVATADANDVMASMGVSQAKQFVDVLVGNQGFLIIDNDPELPPYYGVAPLLPDVGAPMLEPIESMIHPGADGVRGTVDDVQLRRVEPRNTPTMHAAAFNFDNFWDGRARHDYNGGSVFGPSDPFYHIYVNCDAGLVGLAHPAEGEVEVSLCEWTEAGGNYMGVDEGEEPIPARIRFSSLGSQAMGPPLSEFEMSFFGRNWQKIGKKLLQLRGNGAGVTPLANQLVAVDDSRLGPWSNQGGANCTTSAKTRPGKPGLCISYVDLIQAAFREELWSSSKDHLNGTSVPMNNDCAPGEQLEAGMQATCDPFDGYVIEVAGGKAKQNDTSEFTQMEANFSLFFGLSVQVYEQLLIPDNTPWDQFNDVNPRVGSAVAQPGEQGTLPPQGIREGVTGTPDGSLNMVPGVGPDEIYGFDIFSGGNLTAALAPSQSIDPVSGVDRNPDGIGGRVGSNPFLRSTRCMLCHLGPEQTDHTNNVQAGLLKAGTEVEYPTPQGSPEPAGNLMFVSGFSLAEEVEENAQDGVEVENQDFLIFGEINGPGDPDGIFNAVVAPASGSAFGDNGVYNIGVRPPDEDIGRGGDDAFGFPLSLAALAMKNLGGEDYEPCDTNASMTGEVCDLQGMANFDPNLGPGGGLYEVVGAGFPFEDPDNPGMLLTDDCAEVLIGVGAGAPIPCEESTINPGFSLEPGNPQLPEYLAEFANNLPAGELSPQIDELGFAPNHITPPPSAEYGEVLFGADQHCGVYDPVAFGSGSPGFGWGPSCPNSQTGVPVNMQFSQEPAAYIPGSLVMPMNGTWPVPNRVRRNASFKAPHLRNVELTGPFFHTGSYLTLRQVVDFYVRGSDFPITSAEVRDGNVMDLMMQAFSFGSTMELNPLTLDGIPDIVTQYGSSPDTFPPGCIPEDGFPNGPNCTPEPATSTPEQAKVALVKFMLALTDERVATKLPPFDQPEIFVPFDGTAPENTGGRAVLTTLSGTSCDSPVAGTGNCFELIPATSASMPAPRSVGFLGVTRNEAADCVNEISHFCR